MLLKTVDGRVQLSEAKKKIVFALLENFCNKIQGKKNIQHSKHLTPQTSLLRLIGSPVYSLIIGEARVFVYIKVTEAKDYS